MKRLSELQADIDEIYENLNRLAYRLVYNKLPIRSNRGTLSNIWSRDAKRCDHIVSIEWRYCPKCGIPTGITENIAIDKWDKRLSDSIGRILSRCDIWKKKNP